MEVMTPTLAGGEHVRDETCLGRGEVIDRLVPEPALVGPPGEIAASYPARSPGSTPTCQDDVATFSVELLRDLTPRLAAAHYQDAPRWQLAFVAIAIDIDLIEVTGQGLRPRRAMRALVGAGGEHNGAGAKVTG
jgi:hypothetical protein